jgi:hypothetical protein
MRSALINDQLRPGFSSKPVLFAVRIRAKMSGKRFRKDNRERHWKRGDYKAGNRTCVPRDQEMASVN